MTSAGDKTPRDEAKRRPRRLAELASGQKGVVSHAQLVAIGFSYKDIAGRLARGELIRLHRGVYAVGHTNLTVEGLLLAAVLAGGDGAAVSHLAAAQLWGIAPGQDRIEISVPRSRRWNPSTVIVHRPHKLVDDILVHKGIAVTTVARTLMDVAPRCSVQELRRMLHEAEVARLTDRVEVYERLQRSPNARGARKLKRVLATNAAPSNSELERRFHQLIVGKGFPAPRRNSVVEIRGERFEVDAWWPDLKLVVELDGFTRHGVRNHFESDRRRDELFIAEGIRVVRVTWKRVTTEHADLLQSLSRLLATLGRQNAS